MGYSQRYENIKLDDSIDKITEKGLNNSSTKLIGKNSILFVVRSGILKHTFPVSIVLRETTVNQDIKALTPNMEYNSMFLLYAFRGINQRMRLECMKSGTTVESIDFNKLKKFAINIPNLKEQKEIVKQVEVLFAKADAIETQYNARYKAFRASTTGSIGEGV